MLPFLVPDPTGEERYVFSDHASDMLREGRAMRTRQELTWSQVVMAANTPMLLRAAMVEGRPDLGVMSSGQVVGVIDELPTVQELLDRIIAEAEETLRRLTG